jgi:WD40 repeat protein
MRELGVVWKTALRDCVTSLAWDPAGLRLAAATLAGEVEVFAAAGGSPRSSAIRGEGVSTLAWSPDGQWLAVGHHGATLAIMGAGSRVTELSLPAWATAVAWCPERGEVAVGAGLAAMVAEPCGRVVAEYPMHPGRVNDVAWDAAGGDLLVASVGGIRFYDPSGSGIDPVAVAPSPGTVLRLAVSPCSELVAGGRLDGCVVVWKLEGGSAQELTGSEGGVEHVSWRCDGRRLAVAAYDELTVWPLVDGEVLQEGLVHCPVAGGPAGAVAFAPSSPLLAWGGRGGAVTVWSPGLDEQPVAQTILEGDVTALGWHPGGGRLAVATVAGSVAWSCHRVQPGLAWIHTDEWQPASMAGIPIFVLHEPTGDVPWEPRGIRRGSREPAFSGRWPEARVTGRGPWPCWRWPA